MADPDVTLRFDVKPGEVPNAENVIRALAAYIDILKAAGKAIDPGSVMEVGLAGVEDGSDIFKLTLRRCESAASHLAGGMKEYPHLSKVAITLGGLIATSVVVVAIENALSDDTLLSDEQMHVFEENNRLLRESTELRRREMEFYGILQEEPAYDAIEFIRPYGDQVPHRVPRSEFAERSGIWGDQSEVIEDPTTRPASAVWDVILIKPTLVPEPRRWRFARDGIEFSALMGDRNFLEALHAQTLQVTLAEGIKMRIKVEYRETHDGENWIPERGSHRIVAVLDPLPPPPPSLLFPGSP
jgi:hypothetical protein